jgi:methionyl-tRNA synthetase
MNNTFYITTPIYYVNSKPHIGSAYCTLACDVLARFKRLDGYDVKFLTGTDEHGQKIEQAANKAGIKPIEFVDKVSDEFRELVKLMNYSPDYFDAIDDDFIRTTNPKHKKVVQGVWRQLVKNGWIYKDKYSGWYCVGDEAYYTKDELIKDADGNFKTDLGKEVEWKEEESYFFRLSEFQEILLALYKHYPEFVLPVSKANEVIAFISGVSASEALNGEFKKDHLQDLSVSRNTFDWGVKIPCDLDGKELLNENGEWVDGLAEHEKHVIYVWLDALFNYVSALGFPDGGDYRKYWKGGVSSSGVAEQVSEKREVFNVVGKEILRFHAVYWPAFLISCEYSREDVQNISDNVEFIKDLILKNILPTTVFAHGFWIRDGRKMSKSLGNVVIPSEEIEWLKEEFGVSQETAVDYLRYYLITDAPFGNDCDYSRERFVTRVNAELVNNIGNLAQRVLSMIYKNFEGRVPKELSIEKNDSWSDFAGKQIIFSDEYLKADLFDKADFFDFHWRLENLLKLADNANEFVEQQAPWTLKKEKKIDELGTVLVILIKEIRRIAILLQPLCPYSAEKLLKAVGVDISKPENVQFSALYNPELYIKSGTVLDKPEGIFPRLSEGK